jgi:hypothetical protein
LVTDLALGGHRVSQHVLYTLRLRTAELAPERRDKAMRAPKSHMSR